MAHPSVTSTLHIVHTMNDTKFHKPYTMKKSKADNIKHEGITIKWGQLRRERLRMPFVWLSIRQTQTRWMRRLGRDAESPLRTRAVLQSKNDTEKRQNNERNAQCHSQSHTGICRQLCCLNLDARCVYFVACLCVPDRVLGARLGAHGRWHPAQDRR